MNKPAEKAATRIAELTQCPGDIPSWTDIIEGECVGKECVEEKIHETYLTLLRSRAKGCPHIHRLLREIQHGASLENALVEAVLGLSSAVEAQRKMLMTFVMNNPPTPIQIDS